MILLLKIQQEGKQVSAKEISFRYKGKDKPNIFLLSLYAEHNEQLKELVGISVALNTYKRHETSLKLFKEFLMSTYQQSDVNMNEVDLVMMEKYKHYLMVVRHNNNNTTVKYIRNLGKVFNMAVERKNNCVISY